MLLINILGLLLIGAIVWWFWLYQPPAVRQSDGAVQVVVENGTYAPARIRLPAGRETRLEFLRKDDSPCSEVVVFPTLEISETLPLGRAYALTLPPLAPGEYPFHCQMQMYRGTLQVEAAA